MEENIGRLNPFQIVIILAMYELTKTNKTIISSNIQQYIKEYFYIIIDDNTFNNSVSKKRLGIERYALSTSKIGAGGQKYHYPKIKNIEKAFFANYKIKATRMQKLIQKLKVMTEEKGYLLDDDKIKNKIKSQKNLRRLISAVNGILNTGDETEAIRYNEFP